VSTVFLIGCRCTPNQYGIIKQKKNYSRQPDDQKKTTKKGKQNKNKQTHKQTNKQKTRKQTKTNKQIVSEGVSE